MPHTTHRNITDRIRQNLVYQRHILQELINHGQHDAALACSEQTLEIAKAHRKLIKYNET